MLHVVIFDFAWTNAKELYVQNPWLVFVLTPAGFLLAAVLVRGLTANRYSHGTEEVLVAYHTPGTQVRSRPFLRRSVGSLATIGTGGSAGLEGAAIYAGAWFASFFVRRARFWDFDEEDRRVLILVGAAAGVAAIFRAPLTGLLFSLEVPYKGDLAKNAFVPGLLASATSYITFAYVVSPSPIFPLKSFPLEFRLPDLIWVVGIGVACGILAWAFVKMNRLVRKVFRHPRMPWEIGALAGGLIVGGLGFMSISIFDRPLVMGPGYDAIDPLFAGEFTLELILALLALKVAATIFTLGTFGVGGIFFQSFIIGGMVAAVLDVALGLGRPSLFVAAGMASFLTAVYKTPIAATAFVAEATASPTYIVPAFIASAVSFVVSGTQSISENQLPHLPRVRYDALEGLRVRDAMQTGVVTVPSNLTVEQFLNDWVLRYRHIAYPVTDKGQLVGWITLEHASAFPPEARKLATVADGMSRQIPTAHPEEPLLEALRRMQQKGTPRFLVVDPVAPNKMVGILAEPDILRLVELRASLEG